MTAFINSFILVFLGEMGDKTQLLSLMLAARYKQPWTILGGVFVATILNHGLAAGMGEWIASYFSANTLKWILATLFIGFAGWILIPDKEEELKTSTKFGVFLTTVAAFFLAEMGDKTQLATIALGARYSNLLLVTVGTTLGMLASNALAIFLGDRLLKRIPMQWVRRFAAALFLAFGIATIISF